MLDLPYLEKLSKFIIANPDKIFIIDEKLTTNKEKFIEHIKAYIDLWRPCLKPFMPEVSLVNGGSYLKIYDNKEVMATKKIPRLRFKEGPKVEVVIEKKQPIGMAAKSKAIPNTHNPIQTSLF